MRRPFVAGNWKMNTDRAGAVALAGELAAQVPADCPVELLVAPPFPYLTDVAGAIGDSPVQLGAQNCYCEGPGAYTGEVAVEMLLDVGCRYVILGHSERRHVLGETDDLINRKVRRAIEKGLGVILCIGELLEERESGKTESVLEEQLAGGLDDLGKEQLGSLVLAYEPVWAIGTGEVATPDQAEEAHVFVRSWLSDRFGSELGERTRIQYGGSVKPDNAADLLSRPNVDGALVGGASLKADAFLGIVEAATKVASA